MFIYIYMRVDLNSLKRKSTKTDFTKIGSYGGNRRGSSAEGLRKLRGSDFKEIRAAEAPRKLAEAPRKGTRK